MAVGGCAAGFILAVIFLALPDIDPTISSLFFYRREFSPDLALILDTTREAIGWIVRLLVALAAAGFCLSLFLRRAFGLIPPEWMFLLLLFVLGPGLLANVVLKNEWGRPRPIQTRQFGGDQPYTPPLVRTKLSKQNRSFVGGEAASFFAIGFGLALVRPARRKLYLAAGCAGGLLVGLVRIARGGHYLSDIVFAGVFMALTAAVCYLAMAGVMRLLGGNREKAAD